MTFLAPLFLLAALAAAIPVILHLVHRQKARELPFSTLRFLRISVQKTRRRRRIQDVLLMLLRAAVLVLIAAGLAKPTATTLSALLGGGATSAVAIVLDNSASMAVTDSGKPRFETARGAVDQILRQLRPGDDVALILTGGPLFPEQGKLDPAHEAVPRVLNQCAVSNERADLGIRLAQARAALAESEAPNKQVFIITDMQRLSWDGLKKEDETPAEEAPPEAVEAAEAAEKARKIPVIVVDCNRDPQPNVAIQGIAIEAAVPIAGVPIKATVELYNAAATPQPRLVELYLDDVKEATSPVLSVGPESRASHVFQFTFQRGGLHRGEARLAGDDGSKLDDRRFFSMEVDQGIPVAVVTPQKHEIPYLDESFYVQQALAPAGGGGSAIRSTVVTAKDLLSEPLSGYAVVFCVNVPAPSAEAGERLRKYVQAGGHLVWFCGDNVDPNAYNQLSRQAEGDLLPAPLLAVRAANAAAARDSWHVASLDKKHRALEHLVEPPSLYQSILVYKHVRMDAGASAGAWVLARLDDGEPILVQRRVGRGSVTMLGTGAHVGWTNLPLRPIFLPLLTRLTFDLAGGEQAFHTALAGSPLVLEFPEERQPITVEVVPPAGTQNRLASKAEPPQPGQVFRYADTHDLGFYALRPLEGARTKPVVFSVNVDPDEAVTAKIDREELKERFGRVDVVFADDPEDLSGTFKTLREGQSLWTPFLAAVLIVLVFETFLSNRLSPKQDVEQRSRLRLSSPHHR